MPAVSHQFSFGAQPIFPRGAHLQALSFLQVVATTLFEAGFTSTRTIGVQDINIGPAWIFRWPTLDNYNTRSDLFWIGNGSGSGTILMATVQDFDIQTPSSNAFQGPNGAPGPTTPTAWPTGNPRITVLGNSGSNMTITVTADAFTITTIASEHGIIISYNNGIANDTQLASFYRPLSSYRHPRTLRFATRNASFPMTFAAPSGPGHLVFDIDGALFPVTFPVGVPLDAGRIAQEATMQTTGFIEADIDEDFGSTSIVFRQPYDAEPVVGLATVTPRFAIRFIDTTADGLGLAIFVGQANAVSATQLTVNSVEWVQRNVRTGATILNRTQNNSATVTRFATALSQSDTLVGAFPVGWTPSDTYAILPGPEMWPHGCDLHSACWQGTAQATSSFKTHLSGTVAWVLTDLLGEAQNHYQVGQTVMIASHGSAVILQLDSLTNFVLNDLATDQGNVVDGGSATGIIRAVYPGSSEIIVDVYDRSLSGYENTPAFVVNHNVTSTLGGIARIIGIRSVAGLSDVSEGWYQRVPVTAISQVDPAHGDYRTVLTLDLSGMTANARIHPDAIIGIYGRMVMQTIFFALGGLDPPGYIGNQYLPFTELATNVDIARQESLLASPPRMDPDWETGSLVLAEVAGRMLNGLGNTSNDVYITVPHFRSVSARNGAFVAGDAIDENGDPTRRWRFMFKHLGSSYGSIPSSANHFWTIGPGAR